MRNQPGMAALSWREEQKTTTIVTRKTIPATKEKNCHKNMIVNRP
jgi:hypothetical protein